MPAQWYVNSAGREYGPFSAQQLMALAQQGRVTRNSKIRHQDDTRWIPASKFKGLFPADVASKPARPQLANSTQRATSDTVQKGDAQGSTPASMPLYLWGIIGATGMFLVCLLCYAVFFASDKDESIANTTIEETITRVEPSIALIKGRFASGSGFIVKPKVLVTNKHVVAGELLRHLQVHFPSASSAKRGPCDVQLLYIDPQRDLAFLSVDTDLPPLDIAPNYTFRRGEEVLVIGNPGISDELVLENAISRGVMSTKASIKGKDYYQLGIAINPGNSGGPVLDMDGRVIAVVTLKAAMKEGLGFSIPIENLHSALAAMAKSSEQKIAVLRSQHRARVVFQYVGLTGAFYKTGMGMYTEAMNNAIVAGRRADTGLSQVREDIQDKLSLFDQVFIDDIQKELTLISTDENLPESTRQRFVDLWTNYLEMRSYVQNPRGSYITYCQKYHELGDTHDRLSEGLKLLLGVESVD